MKNKIIATTFAFFCISTFAKAQVSQSTNEKKSAVELNVLLPIYPGNLIQAKYTRTLWQKGNLKGDILIGFNIDVPHNRESEGNFSEFSLLTGYRQYLYKGFFIEATQFTGYGRLRNHVSTKKDYDSFDWLVNGTAGYKFDIGKSKKLYAIAQFGIANVIYKSNPWPIFEDKTLQKEVGETPFPYGGIQIGYKF